MTADTRFEFGIIGAGILGEALLMAISKAGISAKSIAISDKRQERTSELFNKHGCAVLSAEDIAAQAKNILLVVKPQDMDALLESIGKKIA